MNNFETELKELMNKVKHNISKAEPKEYKCKQCKDTGVIEIDMQTAKPCKCKIEEARKKRMEKLLEFADIPPIFKGLNLSDFETEVYGDEEKKAKVAKHIAFNYIKHFNKADKGLYFYSETPGSGKTMLSLIIGNEIMRVHEETVKYTTVSDLTETLKSNFKNNDVSNKEILDSFSTVDLLILDDIGQENATGWTEEQLFNILDKRQDFAKPTLFTSNLQIEELPYSERLKSRIKRMTEISVVFPEEDIRVAKAKEDTDFSSLLLKDLEL